MDQRAGPLEALERVSPTMPALTKRGFLGSFAVLSSGTACAILFSVMTSKAIAVIAGPEGIAVMGLFRTLGALVSGTITMGFATIVNQRLSKASDQSEIDSVLGAAALLFMIQAALVLLLAVAMAAPLGRWLLGSSFTGVTAGEVRIVLAMALINVLLGLITAALNGQSDIKAITAVQLGTSVGTLLMIYPLLCLGRKGLAVNVGSGGIVGVCLGLYYIRKIYRFSPIGPWTQRWATLRGSASTSTWIIVHTLVVMGGLLTVQKILARFHGLEALGEFNASMLVIDAAILVIISPARTYILPALGRLKAEGQKHALLTRVLALGLAATTAASAVLMFGAKPTLLILFSHRFLAAADVLAILSLSLVGMSCSYCFNSFLLHKNDIGTFVIIDMTWIAAMLGGVWACGYMGLSVSSMAWSYTGSCVLSATLYAWVCTRRYGTNLLTRGNLKLGLGSFAWLCAAFQVSHDPSLLRQGAFIGVSLATAWTLGLFRQLNEWLEFERTVVHG